jgi:hypothetical protein
MGLRLLLKMQYPVMTTTTTITTTTIKYIPQFTRHTSTSTKMPCKFCKTTTCMTKLLHCSCPRKITTLWVRCDGFIKQDVCLRGIWNRVYWVDCTKICTPLYSRVPHKSRIILEPQTHRSYNIQNPCYWVGYWVLTSKLYQRMGKMLN